MSAKRKRTVSPERQVNEEENATQSIFRSDEVLDRQSTFIGFYSPTLTPKELQKLPEIKDASHKIVGWRRESNQQSLTSAKKYVVGHDDDGEKFGGKKVEQCLVSANVTGACVVARWYGGVMLGPVRFTHMETCALGAIREWRGTVEAEITKKRKILADAEEKERLVDVLAARDQSITVLRKLANDKDAMLKALVSKDETELGQMPSTSSQSTPPVAVVPNYQAMDLVRLQGLEKAKDATLAFLLKRIDKAELDIKKETDKQKEDG